MAFDETLLEAEPLPHSLPLPDSPSLRPALYAGDIAPAPLTGNIDSIPKFPTVQSTWAGMSPAQQERFNTEAAQTFEEPGIKLPAIPENTGKFASALTGGAVAPEYFDIAAGAVNTGTGMASALTTPEALYSTPLFLNPTVGGGLLAGLATKSIGQNLGKLSVEDPRRTLPETTEAILQPALATYFAKGMLKAHPPGVEAPSIEGLSKEAVPGELSRDFFRSRMQGDMPADRQLSAPKRQLSAPEVQPQPQEPNAQRFEEPTTVHGDLRTLTGEGPKQVPIEEGGSGIRPNPTEEPAPAKAEAGKDVLSSLIDQLKANTPEHYQSVLDHIYKPENINALRDKTVGPPGDGKTIELTEDAPGQKMIRLVNPDTGESIPARFDGLRPMAMQAADGMTEMGMNGGPEYLKSKNIPPVDFSITTDRQVPSLVRPGKTVGGTGPGGTTGASHIALHGWKIEGLPEVGKTDEPTPKATGAADAIQRIEQMPDAEALKLNQKAESYAGLTFTPQDVPALRAALEASNRRLEVKSEVAGKNPGASIQADYKAEYARNFWLSGAIEIANKKGPNYEAMLADVKKAAEAAPVASAPPEVPDGFTKRDGKWYYRPNKLSTEVEVTDADVIAGLENKVQPEKVTPPPLPVTKAETETPIAGAKAGGEPPYSAIQQLVDQLKTKPPTGTPESTSARQAIVNRWSAGKSLVDRAIGRMRNWSESLKDTARGVRSISDVDRTVAKLDATLQQSAGESRNAGRALERYMPNEIDRSASALLMEPGMTPAVLADALTKLPEKTSPKIRRIIERAAKATPEMREFADSMRRFFGIREQDAVHGDLFEQGLRDYYTHVWEQESNMPDSLRAAMNSGRVSTYFQFARQRKIPTLLEGILQGKKPVIDPAKVIPFYNYAMDRALASREFIRQLTEVNASDGRPVVGVAGQGVRVEPTENTNPSILIKPKAKPEELADYRPVEHSAMQKWKWASKTEDGTPIFLKGDLLVHPEAHERLARLMDRSRLSSGPVMRAALKFSGEVKGLKLGGLPSLFHPIHVGTHALFHWTNPFKTEPIQWDAPATRFALEQGHLKLAPNPAELNVFSEGLGSGSWAQKLPIVGRWNKAFSEWLFADYIPKLKLKTFENAYARAQWMKKNMGAYKGLSDEQIAARTGDSVNNAYGELNHLFLGKMGRSPGFQRGLRLAFLAPDFGEARGRFVGKILTKTGHEEQLAAATLFASLYFGARLANSISHGDPEMDIKRAFSVKIGKHWWSMRSVLGDVVHAWSDPGQFVYVRLNPVFSRTASDFLWGRDPRTGRKLTLEDKVENMARQFVPIPLSGLTQQDRTLMESFLQSMGVSNQRDTPVMDMQKLASSWRESKGLDSGSEFIPSEGPSYWKLRTALNLGRTDYAAKVLADLRKTHNDGQISQAMNTWARHPFTGNLANESEFVKTLTPIQHQLYQKARAEQVATLQDFYKLMGDNPDRLGSSNRNSLIFEQMAH